MSVTGKRGFTLVELMAVITIAMIIIGITMPALGRMRQRSQAARTQAIINRLEMALAAYERFWGFYPPGGKNNNLNDPAATKTLYEYLCSPSVAGATQSNYGRGSIPAFIEPKEYEVTALSGEKIFVDGWGKPLFVYTANPGPLFHNKRSCDIYSTGPNFTPEINDNDDDGDGAVDEADEIGDDIHNWGYDQ